MGLLQVHSQHMDNQAVIVRPVGDLAELYALTHDPNWVWYRCRVQVDHHIIVAVTGDGSILAYCAVELDLRQPQQIVIAALESRQRGIGRLLLDALKLRAVFLLVEDVPVTLTGFWMRNGFVSLSAQHRGAREEEADTTVDLSWSRWDDTGYDKAPLEPFWPESVEIGRLVARESENWQRQVAEVRDGNGHPPDDADSDPPSAA